MCDLWALWQDRRGHMQALRTAWEKAARRATFEGRDRKPLVRMATPRPESGSPHATVGAGVSRAGPGQVVQVEGGDDLGPLVQEPGNDGGVHLGDVAVQDQ